MKLTALYIHPIKACAAIAVARAEFGRRGLAHDRRYMIVGENGRFLSQRTLPQMALLTPSIAGDAIVLRDAARSDLGELRVPLSPRVPPEAPRRLVTVWRDEISAQVIPEATEWLTRALGVAATLVYQPDDAPRPVSFADGYPCLLTSEASLADVSARAGVPFDMRRFRPNLVVDGGAPFDEESWRAIRVGGVTFRHAKPCERCTVPNVDPDTGEVGREPIRTLAGYRAVAKEGEGNAVFFGINLIPESEGEIRVGDEVTL